MRNPIQRLKLEQVITVVLFTIFFLVAVFLQAHFIPSPETRDVSSRINVGIIE
jgi:hypothetical protein